MKYLVIILFILTACTKEKENIQPSIQCTVYSLLSDKYTLDSIYIKTDSLVRKDKLCGRWIDSIRKQNPVPLIWPLSCPAPNPLIPEFRLELRRYVLGNTITYPKIFK